MSARLVKTPSILLPVPAAARPAQDGCDLHVVAADKRDPLLTIRGNAVREDRVARPRLHDDPGLHVVRDRVPLAAAGAADRVIRGAIADDDAVDLVAQRRPSR